LGRGASCKVKLAQDLESGRPVAIKVMNSTLDEKLKVLIMNEVSAMDALKHENIINQYEYGTGEIVDSDNESVKNTKVVNYIVLELAHGGELFDFIANTGMFGESLARYFFIQFMTGLGYCH
jgi:serine/threonine protein kinase